MAALAAGAAFPDVTLTKLVDGAPTAVKTGDFKGKKVVLFGVPFAFSPTCQEVHAPSYLEKYDDLKAKGVDIIGCFCAVDPFVMRAWGKQLGVEDKIEMFADANRELTKALGIEVDLSALGLGVTSQRCALVIEDGSIKHIGVEESPSNTNVSTAQEILKVL